MKTIDYSPTIENKFIICDYGNNGSFKLFIDGLLVYNSHTISDIYFNNVLFSYNGLNVIFRQHTPYGQELYITPLNQIQQNNIELGSIFRFNTDSRIQNYIVSTNSDQVAILFHCKNYYNNSITGVTSINLVNRMDNFLNVYDFSNNRLLFQKIYDRDIIFSISEINTIAVSSNVVEDDEGINLFEIAIFDLITGNRLNNTFYQYEILFIQYFPEIEPNYNKLLVIIRGPEDTQNIKILDLENDFREIYTKNIDGYIVNTVNVTRNGQIAIGTQTGLIYLPTPEEEQIPQLLFTNLNIQNIIFSQSGNKIKVACIDFDEISDQEYLSIHHYNIVEPDDDIPLENVDQFEPIRIVDEEEPEIEIADPQLDIIIPTAPTDPIKLSENENKLCFDPIQVSEENIGQFLSSDVDNLVIFYKEPSANDFFATCLTFTTLKKYMKDPKMIFYRCVQGKDFRTYCDDPLEFLKIPGRHTIFVNYQDMKTKYMQRQNMIFVENSFRIENTITFDASYLMRFVSSNHCQKGSIIDVYRIIF